VHAKTCACSTAWFEWFPETASDFSGIEFSAGDTVTVTVSASSTTSGTVVITNNSKGMTVTQQLTSSSALCQQDAEWIVEDFDEGGSLVPFANFGTVTFSAAEANTPSGPVGPQGATLIDISQSTVLASTSIEGSDVVVQYGS
jgi:hypothetical protein